MLIVTKRNYRYWAAVGLASQMILIPRAWPDDHGQDQGAADQPQLAEVVVTGSLLKLNIDQESALPLTTLSAGTLQSLNATTPQAAVGLISQNQYAATSNTTVGSGTAFASYANLRSLGSSRTLVLFDGERVANDPYQDLGVNLDTIPLALLDRVEVLADGASAIYGSDAIAGVVNLIPRQEFSGANVTVSGTGLQEKGGGGSTYVDAAAGIGSLSEDHWNLYVGGTWRRQTALSEADRSFTDVSYIPSRGYNRLATTAFPGNYTQSGTLLSSVNPAYPACNRPTTVPDGGIFGPNSCGFDTAAYGIDAIPDNVQYSALARATVQAGGVRATVQYFRAYDDIVDSISPVALNGVPMTPNNPYFPGEGITPGTPGLNPTAPITAYFRLLPAGPSTSNVLTVTDRLDGKLQGTALGWDYELWALRSISTVDFRFAGGYEDIPAIKEGLTGANGAPFINPFGPQSTAGQMFIEQNALRGVMQYARSELDMVGAQISRDIVSLPAGPVALALATSGRYDDASFSSNPVLSGAIGSALSPRNTEGHRNIASLTGQIDVPITERLDLDAAGRFDRYSDVGDTTNPQVSLRYRPLKRMLLRTSYGRGFRAPTLYDVDAPLAFPVSSSRNNDPVLCPGGVPDLAAGAVPSRDCRALFPTETGGNIHLQPERSTTYGVGGVVQVTRSFSAGVDYFNYRVDQSIGTLTNTVILGNPAKYGSLIVRCSEVAAAQLPLLTTCSDPAGNPIGYTVGTELNLGETKTSGLDFTSQWSGVDTKFGRFAFSYQGTYVLKHEYQLERGGPFFSSRGQYFAGFPVIKYSHLTSVTWQLPTWSTQLSNRFESGYTDCNAGCLVTPTFFNSVGSYSLWNLSLAYTGLPNLTVRFLVTNMFNTDPPFTNKNTGLGFGYDERFTDPLGRAFTLSLHYEFGGRR